MEKIKKEDVIKLMTELKAKGYSNPELAVMLNRSTQTIWCWSSEAMPKRVPAKSDYEVLKRLLVKERKKENEKI